MKLGIGTVQFGMKYGLTNHTDKTSMTEAKSILNLAQKHGIQILDTAKDYGNSEEVLGKILTPSNSFKITTKIPILSNEINATERVKSLFFHSLNKLNQPSIYGLLLHNARDLLSSKGHEFYKVLSNLKDEGFIKKIGISVYDQIEIEEVLQKFQIDLIQLPINIFDQRMIQSNYLKGLHELGIEIHARSIFLQGLLLEDPNKLPTFFEPIKNNIILFQNEMKKQNITLIEAALNFVENINEIDHVVVGVNNAIQLEEILLSLNKKWKDFDFSHFAINNEKFLKPMNWVID